MGPAFTLWPWVVMGFHLGHYGYDWFCCPSSPQHGYKSTVCPFVSRPNFKQWSWVHFMIPYDVIYDGIISHLVDMAGWLSEPLSPPLTMVMGGYHGAFHMEGSRLERGDLQVVGMSLASQGAPLQPPSQCSTCWPFVSTCYVLEFTPRSRLQFNAGYSPLHA